MRVIIFLIATIVLFPANSAICQNAGETDTPAPPPISEKNNPEKNSESARTKMIGFVFKILAKAIVSTADMEQLKKDGIDKINKMDEESFRALYLDFYEDVYDFHFLTVNYGLDKDTTKDTVIEKIKSLDKPKLYKIIDFLPDTIIAREFRKYLFNNRQEIKKTNNIGQIMQLLNKMIESVKIKYFGEKRNLINEG